MPLNLATPVGTRPFFLSSPRFLLAIAAAIVVAGWPCEDLPGITPGFKPELRDDPLKSSPLPPDPPDPLTLPGGLPTIPRRLRFPGNPEAFPCDIAAMGFPLPPMPLSVSIGVPPRMSLSEPSELSRLFQERSSSLTPDEF